MPSIRVGYGSDFVVKDQKVGIGSDNPQATLDVVGDIRGNFNLSGVTTLTSYSGFKSQKQNIYKPSTIGFGTVGVGTQVSYYETETDYTEIGSVEKDLDYTTLSEDLIVDSGQILNITNTDMVGVTTIGEQDPHTHQSHLSVGSLEQVSVTDHFSVPSGGIDDRKDNPIEGTVRFNDDLATLEFFNGVEWKQFTYNQGQSGRAVFAGGYTPTSGDAGAFASVIDYANITTKGNATSFGEMHDGTYAAMFGFSSATRGLFGGGYKNGTSTANNTDTSYITIASEGNTQDFGNLNSSKNWGKAGASSSTRGLAIGGFPSTTDMDYVQIATTGNFVDFGDLNLAAFGAAGMGSPTTALHVSGGPNGIIEQITIASLGSAVKWAFFDKTNSGYYTGGGSNSVRGLYNKTRRRTTLVQSIIIASSGVVEDFGNLASTISNSDYQGSNGNCASQTTLLFAGGGNTAAAVNTIETISITTAGNATDFGDMTTKRGYMGSCSDSHGGLGGF